MRIAHLSDIHFGAEHPSAAAALPAYLRSLAPQVVVISGDFTQRARAGQFARATAWISSIGLPVLAVPGNHDLSVYAMWRRAFLPLTRYERMARAFSPSRETLIPPPKLLGRIDCAWRWDFPGLGWRFIGLNSARRMVADLLQPMTNGGLSERQIALVETESTNLPTGHRLAVIMHHPLVPPPGLEGRHGTRCLGAAHTLDRFEKANVSLVMGGHLHRSYKHSAAGLVISQAGTATSTRLRGEGPGFHLIDTANGEIRVSRRAWSNDVWG